MKASDFNAGQHLTLSDIATDSKVAPTFIQLTLKVSKTDPGGKGVKIVIGKTDDELCPVQAIFKYLRRRGGQEGPLFLRENSTPLTKPYFVKCVRRQWATMKKHSQGIVFGQDLQPQQQRRTSKIRL